MNNFKLSLIALGRDWRSGELLLIAIAIIIAVASLTSVNFFTDRVRQATEQQATELLAADLVLRSSKPISESIVNTARQQNLITTRTTSFRSMVVAGKKLQMAEIKAVENGYPIRGKIRITASLFGKEQIAQELPEPGTAWADARLLQLLDITPGQKITLGVAQLTIGKIISYEPDRGGDIFNIAPRLMINRADVSKTELILPGSRVQYKLLLGGQFKDITAFRDLIKNRQQENIRVQGIRDARPELKRALERAEQFLGLAALVSIALAGLAVAMSAQRYAIRHYDNCAIMRCLGAEQKTITQIYLSQLLILSVICSLAGCLIGYVGQESLASLMVGLSTTTLPAPSLRPVFTGVLAGITTVVGFGLPQILRLRTVSPLRVLRRDLEPVPLRGRSIYAIAVFTLALLAPWQSGNASLTLYTFLGILATGVILLLSSKYLIRYLSMQRSRVGVASRYGLANVARRASLSTAQIIGIGLGVMVMLLLTLIRTDLLENWQDRIPEGTPNYFLINIQPDEVKALYNFLSNRADVSSDIYPMVRGRLTAINNNPVLEENYQDQRARRLATREFNLSWAETMQPDNKLVAGKWWDGNESGTVFSVEEEIARTLGINIGDKLRYSIAGREINGEVINLRWVEWDSFNVNFFVIANPGMLEEYPATYITSFFMPARNRDILPELVRNFPSVTIFDVDALLTQVRTIMQQVVKTVEFVFGFTLIAGILVMFAALQTTHNERTHESALLSALGASRKQILSSLIAEFFMIGLIAGVMAGFMATLIEFILAEYVFKMEVVINPLVWFIAPLVCISIIVIGGLLGTYRVLYTPPIVALRKV